MGRWTLFDLVPSWMFICVWGCAHVRVGAPLESREDPLELESASVVSCPTWVMETEPRGPLEEQQALSSEPSLQSNSVSF